MELEPDSERMIVENFRGSAGAYLIYLFHEATYRFAAPYARDRQVLDLGSGSGYGSAMLADTARSVVGVDVSEKAVGYARARFPAANLAFRVIEADQRLPFDDQSFDVVTCFQVIEHVRDANAFVGEMHRVLRPGGVALIATPDRDTRLFPGQRPWNRWHLVEYSGETLSPLLSSTFEPVEMRYMTGRRDVVARELARCRMLRVVTFPFTFPGAPEWWRVHGLNLFHRLKGTPRPAPAPQVAPDFGFGVDDLVIGEERAGSVNLVAIATRR